tara:strand:+ start:1446 stop:2408 length:963 start_codon:yes stop_codon:yes gene_type:complete
MNTPIEFLPRLSKQIGGTEIWIKRDDCTGLSTGGNKTRKLEFLMAEAIEQDCDLVITHGATQSNHVRQTSAAAAKLGLKCHVLLENRTSIDTQNYKQNGNVLLNSLHGATSETREAGLDMDNELLHLAKRFESNGYKPYVIPGGGSNVTGALGYVNCAQEIIYQSSEMGKSFDYIVHATGSAGTQAGLLVGLKLLNSGVPLLGIGVRAPRVEQEEKVFQLAKMTSKKICGLQQIDRNDVKANCEFVGNGYGIPDDLTLEAIRLFASTEGILLDPVYSGKGAAGLVQIMKNGFFERCKRVLFIHTGGVAALPSYLEAFSKS